MLLKICYKRERDISEDESWAMPNGGEDEEATFGVYERMSQEC